MNNVKLKEKELLLIKKTYCGNFKRYFYFIGAVFLFGLTIVKLVIFIYLTLAHLLPHPNILRDLIEIFGTGLLSLFCYVSYLLNKVISHYENELAQYKNSGANKEST